MKIKKYGIGLIGTSLIAIVLFNGCHNWKHDVTVEGIDYEKIRYNHENQGRPFPYSVGLLKDHTVIAGRVYKGWLRRYDNGQVESGMLAKQTLVNDLVVPQDTWIEFQREGMLKKLRFPRNMIVQGYKVIGTGGGAKGAVVTFHRNGKIKYFFSPEDVVIQSVPCRGGIFHIIGMDDNGLLQSCTASKNFTYMGREIKSGQKLVFKDRQLTVVQ